VDSLLHGIESFRPADDSGSHGSRERQDAAPERQDPFPTPIPTHTSGVTWHQHDGPRKALALRGPFAFPDRHASQRNRSVLISRSAQPPRTLDAIDKPGQLCVTLAPQEAPDHAPRDGHAGPDQGMKERAVFAAVLSQA